MDHIQKIDALFDLWQQGLCPGGQVLVRHHGEVFHRILHFSGKTEEGQVGAMLV